MGLGTVPKVGGNGQLVGQILALILASHHSGLIDAMKPDGRNGFIDRMEKADEKNHKTESLNSADEHLIQELENLLDQEFVQHVLSKIARVTRGQKRVIGDFNLGFFTRMLFSCLIDADRINSADFENPENKQHRNAQPIDWSIPIGRFEQAISELKGEKPIDELRRDISNTCRERALEKPGIYTLTVPTGGGNDRKDGQPNK